MNMRIYGAAAAILAVCSVPLAASADETYTEEQQFTEVVKAINLARMASAMCPNLVLDKQVVQNFIDMGPISDVDLTEQGKYGDAVKAIKDSFNADYAKDPAAACENALSQLGGKDVAMLKRS